MKKITGGYDNYSLKSGTLIEGYMPGPMRTNLLLDPELAIGKFDPGTFGSDQWYNGPGTLLQALPDASRFQNTQIFAIPRGNPYKEFGVDDRQIAEYQVEQLLNNPLSQYTNNPNGEIPGFECMDQPDSYSTMINKRENEYKNFFENFEIPSMKALDVYPRNGSATSAPNNRNPNADVVYNLSLNSRETVNPMIVMGSSSKSRSAADFTGKCYSGNFNPVQKIPDTGGNNSPYLYNNGYVRPRTQMDQGIQNNRTNEVCVGDKSLKFINSLMLNSN
jgi:hypothetical protein